MDFRPPVTEIAFMARLFGLNQLEADGLAPEIADSLTEAILEEAGKFAAEQIAPLNRIGDTNGAQFQNGRVITPEGWATTYQEWAQAGWNSLTAPTEFGGQGLPHLLYLAANEMWTSASMAFMLGPMLTSSAVDALVAHGSDELKSIYLQKLVSGEWMGTMNLTEPQAGSDVGALKTKAVKQGDGTYRISGQKIYITYGDHDMVDNIIHLVLARLPDAPQGSRGISLFLVPKFLVNADGSLGKRNDLRCAGIEHKLGIHGSPTCTIIYGDHDGAIGYLIGEENRGLNCMFTMMNSARLGVGLQGVAIAERATQLALSYANERKQGKAILASDEGNGSIIDHPDVLRMLTMMRAKTEASRAICYMTAAAIDRSHRETDESKRKAAEERAALLTPIAKSWSTDIGIEVASLGIQVHGGMGFIEGSGAAQHLRDARIAAIYEGTNGIQAIDLVMRKLPLAQGGAIRSLLADGNAMVARFGASDLPSCKATAANLADAMSALEKASRAITEALNHRPAEGLAVATPFQELCGIALGGAALAEAATHAKGTALEQHYATLTRFFATHVSPLASALVTIVSEGGDALASDLFAISA